MGTQDPRLPDLGPIAYLGTDEVVVMEDLTLLGYKAMDDWAIRGFHDYNLVQQVSHSIILPLGWSRRKAQRVLAAGPCSVGCTAECGGGAGCLPRR